MSEYKLYDVINQSIIGIFARYQQLFNPNWMSADMAALIDDEYINGHSGEKIISPRLYRMIGNHILSDEDAVLNAADITKIAQVFHMMFADNWKHYAGILSAQYNPIHNYDMTETETPAEYTKTVTPSETTETIRPAESTVTITNNSGIYGFDSTEASPSDTTLSTSVGTVQTAGSNKLEVDAAGSERFEVNSDRTLSRSGNIGVTTTMQMLESEQALWSNFNFAKLLFADADSILTIPIY